MYKIVGCSTFKKLRPIYLNLCTLSYEILTLPLVLTISIGLFQAILINLQKFRSYKNIIWLFNSQTYLVKLHFYVIRSLFHSIYTSQLVSLALHKVVFILVSDIVVTKHRRRWRRGGRREVAMGLVVAAVSGDCGQRQREVERRAVRHGPQRRRRRAGSALAALRDQVVGRVDGGHATQLRVAQQLVRVLVLMLATFLFIRIVVRGTTTCAA